MTTVFVPLPIDHGALTGLSDDDHAIYLLVSGTRAMAGNLNMGGFSITNVNLVDGVDLSTVVTASQVVLRDGTNALTGAWATGAFLVTFGASTTWSGVSPVRTFGSGGGGPVDNIAKANASEYARVLYSNNVSRWVEVFDTAEQWQMIRRDSSEVAVNTPILFNAGETLGATQTTYGDVTHFYNAANLYYVLGNGAGGPTIERRKADATIDSTIFVNVSTIRWIETFGADERRIRARYDSSGVLTNYQEILEADTLTTAWGDSAINFTFPDVVITVGDGTDDPVVQINADGGRSGILRFYKDSAVALGAWQIDHASSLHLLMRRYNGSSYVTAVDLSEAGITLAVPPPATGNAGGDFQVFAANGVGSDQDGGNVEIDAGSATGAGLAGTWLGVGGTGASTQGGSATLRGGSATGAGVDGGTAILEGGTVADGRGGFVELTAAPGVGTNRVGGGVVVTAGNGTGSGAAGSISLICGDTATGSAGGIDLTAGDASGAGTGGTITLTPGATSSGTDGSVRLKNAAGTNRIQINSTGIAFFNGTPAAQSSAVVALTDNSAGTANDTIEALTSGTVYATDVAAIRNNFADLAAKVNALITHAKTHALMAT